MEKIMKDILQRTRLSAWIHYYFEPDRIEQDAEVRFTIPVNLSPKAKVEAMRYGRDAATAVIEQRLPKAQITHVVVDFSRRRDIVYHDEIEQARMVQV